MKRILVIGIGSGDPDHLTLQAVDAMRRADVFFVMDKGPAKARLIALRHAMLARHRPDGGYRVVEAASPERGPDGASYAGAVEALNRDKQQLFERLIGDALRDGECGAFLVWGDPALYDSTMRIVGAIAAAGRHAIEWAVIPGISSVQALAARHRVPLNEIGRGVAIVNGRGLPARLPEGADSVVVMLDARNAFERVEDDVEIYWGAYVGTADEILVAGPLAEVKDEIARVRAEARARHGWIMDTYVLKRRVPSPC
ncbi:MAG: precorrin-6A synthase (deacetylating) [Burkholderia sp.]